MRQEYSKIIFQEYFRQFGFAIVWLCNVRYMGTRHYDMTLQYLLTKENNCHSLLMKDKEIELKKLEKDIEDRRLQIEDRRLQIEDRRLQIENQKMQLDMKKMESGVEKLKSTVL